MINLQCRIFTSEIDIIEWDWNKFQPHLFINNCYNSCTSVSIWVSPFPKKFKVSNTRAFSLTPWFYDVAVKLFHKIPSSHHNLLDHPPPPNTGIITPSYFPRLVGGTPWWRNTWMIPYWTLLNLTGPYWPLLGHIGPYWGLYCICWLTDWRTDILTYRAAFAAKNLKLKR